MNEEVSKKGASYLLKGGTLLAESCQSCGNLQIEYKGNIICLGCQKNSTPENVKEVEIEEEINERRENINLIQTNKKLILSDDKLIADGKKTVEEDEDITKIIHQVKEKMKEKITESISIINKEQVNKEQITNLKILYLCLRILEQTKRT